MQGGAPISSVSRDDFDFTRLERAVVALTEVFRRQRDENVSLRRKLEEKGRHIRSLEGQLLEANQRQQDVAKRIDELISQLDHLEGQLGNAER